LVKETLGALELTAISGALTYILSFNSLEVNIAIIITCLPAINNLYHCARAATSSIRTSQ
jgi:hypothetical protein